MNKNVVRHASLFLIAALLIATFGAAWQSSPASADDCAPSSSNCAAAPATPRQTSPTPSAYSLLYSYDSGWYDNDGDHFPANTNYITGNCSSCTDDFGHNSFFVFDLSGVSASGPAVAAILWLYNPDYNSPDNYENLEIYDVGTPLGNLLGGTGGISAYNDLSSGLLLGSAIAPTQDGNWIPVVLNADGLNVVNAALGSGTAAFGGTLSSLSGNFVDEHVFGYSGGTPAELEIYYDAGPNLLINPGYDSFVTAPKAWLYSIVNVPLSSLRDCNYAISGCSLKLSASRSTSIVTQTVSYNGVGGEYFVYGVSSAAYNVPGGGSYKVEAALFNRFNRVSYTDSHNFSTATHAWETMIGGFYAPAAFTKIRFRIYFQKSAGIAWFDDAFLHYVP